MVSHAYDWLTAQQKKFIKNMSINYSENKSTLVLRSSRSSEKLKIEYQRAGNSTTIKASGKLIQVDDNFVNVFCEDLEEFIMHQKSFLPFFAIQFDRVDNSNEDYRPNKLVAIVSMISETLEHLLKSRNYKIRVVSLFLDLSDVAQLISILNQLDLSVLKDATTFRKNPNFRKLDLRLNKFTTNYLKILNKKLYILYHTWSQVLQNPLIMQKITKNLSCFDIQRLRKVSKSIRDVIDLIKSDPNIVAVLISKSAVEIILKNGDRKRIYYEDQITMGNDLGINLKHQKTSLKELRLDFLHMELLEIFKNTLTLREAPLKVEKLTMNQPELLEIVPRLCGLKSIEIKGSNQENSEICLEKFSETEQWGNAENLIIDSSITIGCPVQNINISNFKFVNITVKTLTINDMVYLKQIYLQTTAPKKFKFNFCNSDYDYNLHSFIGSLYAHIPGIRTIWYFQKASSEKWLHIILHEQKTVIFLIVQRDLIPEGVSKTG